MKRVYVTEPWGLTVKKRLANQISSPLPHGCLHRALFCPTVQQQPLLLLEFWVTLASHRTAPRVPDAWLDLPHEAFNRRLSIETYRMNGKTPVYPQAALSIHRVWSDALSFDLQRPQLALAQHRLEPTAQHQPLALLTFWRSPMPTLANELYRQALTGIRMELEVFVPFHARKPRTAKLSAATLELAAD